MKIEVIEGKRLVARVPNFGDIDEAVMSEIVRLCESGKVLDVAMVYPIERTSELTDFWRQIVAITGKPIEGFSYSRDTPGEHSFPGADSEQGPLTKPSDFLRAMMVRDKNRLKRQRGVRYHCSDCDRAVMNSELSSTCKLCNKPSCVDCVDTHEERCRPKVVLQ